jgi:hypothetical protein
MWMEVAKTYSKYYPEIYVEWLRDFTNSFFFSLVSLGGVRLSPLGTSATVGLLHQSRMIDDDYGAVGGMRIGRGNRSTRRKPAPVPLCPPQFPHDLGSNPGRRGGKPATNRLSCGTALTNSLSQGRCFSAVNRTEHLPNRIPELYRYINLLASSHM